MIEKHLIVAIALFLTIAGANAADGAIESAATSGFDSANSTEARQNGAMSAVAKLRKNRSQTQFEQTMKRHYPDGYKILVGLNENDRVAVYEQYKGGARMNDVRRSVYAAAQKEKVQNPE